MRHHTNKCRLCGYEPMLINDLVFWVKCGRCNNTTADKHFTPELAVDAWNDENRKEPKDDRD